MGTPEDVATEKYFTLPTLTTVLRENLKMEPGSDAEAQACEEELATIKSTFKDWLRTVGLPNQGAALYPVVENARQLLITLVDEPE